MKKLPFDIKLPKGQLSKQTSTALKIINTDFPPSFIQMEIGGFDTHQNQIIRQNRLLKELSEKASKKGIKIIMDIIPNHCGSEHWFFKDPPTADWFNNQNKYNCSNN